MTQHTPLRQYMWNAMLCDGFWAKWVFMDWMYDWFPHSVIRNYLFIRHLPFLLKSLYTFRNQAVNVILFVVDHGCFFYWNPVNLIIHRRESLHYKVATGKLSNCMIPNWRIKRFPTTIFVRYFCNTAQLPLRTKHTEYPHGATKLFEMKW